MKLRFPRPSQDGMTTLELVVWAPIMLIAISAIIGLGRMTMADQAVEAAAFESARQMSLRNSASDARSAGRDWARSFLANQGLQCRNTRVNVNTTGFSRTPGQGASVSVTVGCRVELSDIAVPGLPGSRWMEATAESPLDRYKVFQ